MKSTADNSYEHAHPRELDEDSTGPDFNTESNLHADTVAERHDAKREDSMKTPRMAAAVKEARGIEEGFALELALAQMSIAFEEHLNRALIAEAALRTEHAKLAERDALLRRWLNWDTRDGLLTQLCEDTERTLEGKS